ncbi:MAG: isoaspartyl peptidase/L-asparaginase, partial [Gemmobacter sp.]
ASFPVRDDTLANPVRFDPNLDRIVTYEEFYTVILQLAAPYQDGAGNIAAATSTGGMTGKTPGRVGDSPVVGGGTFADNATCAVSGTGHGEVFIRWCAAHEIAARMRHAGQSLHEAAEHVVMRDLAENDGSGGLIAVDAAGNVAMPFNSPGMYRGCIERGGPVQTFIYR